MTVQHTPEQLAMIAAARGCEPYAGWQPYCLRCSTMRRMDRTTTGFRCSCCKNNIGFNLQRLPDSPTHDYIKHRQGVTSCSESSMFIPTGGRR